MVEMQEIHQQPWWALPILSDGEPKAVLVVRGRDGRNTVLSPEVLAVLRASAGLGEPLLRQWREAERNLFRHAVEALRGCWRKLRGPGHLTWKVGAGALALTLCVLLLWPVTDRVTAHTVIEGRVRHVLTAPFEGFVAEVLVRPGESVTEGQLLARLDDRELKLEQRRFSSERDQAVGKVRQAMAEHDASALILAQTDVQQAEAQLAMVEAKLARAGLVAPMDGLVVTGDWVQQIGSPVEVGREMFEIAATGGYRVVLHVADRDISRIHLGQHGMLRLTGQPQTTYAFDVSRVTATAKVEEGINGFRVEAEWRGDVPPLSPGMQGVGKIEVGRSNLLTVWTRSSIDWLRLKLWSWWW
jgi:multidrug resistance efflux pump